MAAREGYLRWFEIVQILKNAGIPLPERADGQEKNFTNVVSPSTIRRSKLGIYRVNSNGREYRIPMHQLKIRIEKVECTRCRRWLDPEEGYYDGPYPGGKQPHCKQCNYDKIRIRRAKKRDAKLREGAENGAQT